VASAERLRRVWATGLLLLVQGSGAVPPPLPQTGADCERPTYASDRLVCGDATLLALDRQVREAWRAIVAMQPANDLPPLLEAQEAWFGRRSRCAFVEAQAACLEAAYRDRSRVLDAWQRAASGAIAGPGTRLRCAGAPWGDATVTVHRPTADALVLSSLDGQALAIATPNDGHVGWRPFVRFEGDVPQLRLRLLAESTIHCSPH
jgi:uncharacterized protein